jgi:hypothetical protein
VLEATQMPGRSIRVCVRAAGGAGCVVSSAGGAGGAGAGPAAPHRRGAGWRMSRLRCPHAHARTHTNDARTHTHDARMHTHDARTHAWACLLNAPGTVCRWRVPRRSSRCISVWPPSWRASNYCRSARASSGPARRTRGQLRGGLRCVWGGRGGRSKQGGGGREGRRRAGVLFCALGHARLRAAHWRLVRAGALHFLIADAFFLSSRS